MASRNLSELERRFIGEAIDQALAEVEDNPDISQGVVDDLKEVQKIIGWEGSE